jgi:hypothetical protein
MDMKKFLQAVDGAGKSTATDSSDMKKFLSVVKEAEINQPAVPAEEPMQSPEQIKYNQLRAQWDGYQAMTDTGPNTFVSKDPAHDAKLQTIPAELTRMAAALKAKGIDAEADYAAIGGPKSASVDINQVYKDESVHFENTGMSRLLSIVTESKNNRMSSAEKMVYMNTPKLKSVKVDESPSLLKAYLTLVEDEHINQADNLKKSLADHLAEVKQDIVPTSKPRNFVAKNATTSGAGAHKDKKKAEKQGDTKHKAKTIPMDESELDEKSVSQAQARTMAAAAHNPEFAKKVKIKQSVAKEFNQADKGKNIKSLPQRTVKKEAIDEGDEQ